MFLRAVVVDEAITPYKLVKLDIQKKDNFFSSDSVNLPTATEILLASSETCSVMLKNTVLKLRQRSPLKYVAVFLI